MISPLLAMLDEVAAAGAPARGPQLKVVLSEVRANAGRVASFRSDSPDPAALSEVLLVETFDDFPNPLRLTFSGRVVCVGGTISAAAMSALEVSLWFARSANTALAGEVSGKVPVQADGTFAVLVDVVFDGAEKRPFALHGEVTIRGAKLPASGPRVEVTNVNLDWFVELVDRLEPKSGAPSPLAFLASLRRVVNSSDDFKVVVGTSKAPSPGGQRTTVTGLFPKGSPMATLIRDASHVRFGGESIAISHVLIGIEGGRKQEPVPRPATLGMIPMFRRPGNLVTWAGDLGGCLGSRFIVETYYLKNKAALTLDQYVAATAGRADLIGDIDGVNLAASYDEKLPLAANLRRYYYGSGSAHRFSLFVAAAETANDTPALALETVGGRQRLTATSRQFIAQEILTVAVLTAARRTAVKNTKSSELGAWKPLSPEVDAILRVDSPEIQKLTSIFVQLVEDGLAAEPP